MRAKCEQGFTIIELTITLACIAVLAAIAMPKFSGYILQAHLQGAKPYLLELAAKQRNYKIENGTYCCSGGTLDEGNLSTNLGLSVASAGDFCFAFVCRDSAICQSTVANTFVSATTAPATTPDFEIWAVLRNSTSGAVAGPGALSCVPITGKQPPTGWVQPSTPATVPAGPVRSSSCAMRRRKTVSIPRPGATAASPSTGSTGSVSPMPACRNRRRRPDEQGYLLIEVLAAMTILSILVLGLANLWSVLGGLSFGQVLRQKAVFALNGEMERLNWLYTTSSFGAGTRLATSGYPTLPNVAGSNARLVYDTTSTNATFVVTSSASLQASNSAVWETGNGTSTRNYVWLDQDRGILAQLSWSELPLSQCSVAGGTNFPCTCTGFSGSGNGNCVQLLLVLSYPFTIQGGIAGQMPGQTLNTLSLRTIVGRRA